ncbi:hypothetical protein F4813DRAFT_397610 [Daldinia decipiens]|uniref:uncharacterized protein n=1 Tax=Daldinia decipiens TaxID=326647 RepID=UPI0020C4BA7F|nr:uncharacterized protein F4813DRAFT_397610 [Daldinia decipiens]KAI1656451.1 hypothetical protein F4813DRAFT_397610 [Daldinia decipiens]
MDVNRVHLLIIQLRKRIRGLALIQDRIQDDVNMFKDGDPKLRDIFEETRRYYLDHLGITIEQLREAMNTSEIELPPDEIFVERIMKRVRPITRRYLERLVQTGRITKCDMECIIQGEYTSVEAFFEDVYNNVESFGTKNDASSSESRQSTSNIEIYDEDGFLTLTDDANQNDEQGDSQDDNTDPQKKAPTDEPGTSVLSSGDIVPPVKLEAPEKPSEDIESEIEKQSSSEVSKLETSALHTVSKEEKASPETESDDPDTADGSFSVDCPVDDQEASLSDTETSSSDDSDVSSLVNYLVDDEEHTQAEESESDEAQDLPQPFLPAIPKTRAHAECDSDEQKDGISGSDDILDTWLRSHEMFYWQYEIIFAAILTSFRFKERFQSARNAYKADPFADWD